MIDLTKYKKYIADNPVSSDKKLKKLVALIAKNKETFKVKQITQKELLK